MNRTVVGASALAAIAIGVGLWATQAGGEESARTFTLEGTHTFVHMVDQAPEGDSPGDMVLIAGDVTRDGKPAGHEQGYCLYITDSTSNECTFSVGLADGQLVITTGYGTFNGAGSSSRDPIVGGSGAYSKARGYAECQETGEDTLRCTVHLEG